MYILSVVEGYLLTFFIVFFSLCKTIFWPILKQKKPQLKLKENQIVDVFQLSQNQNS